MVQNNNLINKKSITGKIEKIIFHDNKSGRSIFSVLQENDKPCRVIGNITGIENDSCITATGSWKKDEKYGWQFLAESIETVSEKEEHEPVEDGLIHAKDFSNVLNKKHKKFRNVFLEYKYDDIDESELEDFDTFSQLNKKKGKEEKKQNNSYMSNTIIVDGALYDRDMTKLISGPKDRSYFSIPNSVICIGGGAFSGSVLEHVEIPESVKSIKNGAFSNCHNLSIITLPNSVEEIGDMVFTGCDNLISISVDQRNRKYCTIDGVLYNHDLSQLLYVPNGLTSVVISEVTTTIRSGAFRGCTKVSELNIPSTLFAINQGEFRSCSQLTKISIPKLIASDGISYYFEPKTLTSIQLQVTVENINSKLFSGCCNLESVWIPYSVEDIDPNAFSDCYMLNTVTVSKNNKSFKSIDGVLYDDSVTNIVLVPRGVTSVVIPNTITDIGKNSFRGCGMLKSVSFPDSITSIGDYAFENCKEIEYLDIPKHVTSIGESAFENCCKLNYVSIPDSVIKIGAWAFYGCTALKEVRIVDIAKWCNIEFHYKKGLGYSDVSFYSANPLVYAQHLVLNGYEIKELIIPNGLTKINNYAFYNCKSIEQVVIPNSITEIGEAAFYGCSTLKQVEIYDLSKWCNIKFHYHKTYPNQYITCDYDYTSNPLVCAQCLIINNCEVKELIIPDGVTKINNYAFYNCKSIERVFIPNSVKEIGTRAFMNCEDITVEMPETFINIDSNAFDGCNCQVAEKTLNIDWKDVHFSHNCIRVRDQIGQWTEIKDENVDSSINSLTKHLKKLVPALTVCFDSEGKATIVNAKELHDAVITLKIKDNLAELIRNGYQPSEILRRIDNLSQNHLREFIPRDMTPYINFLLEKHAGDRYPIVPVEEYIGGRREEGALYTIIINGQPNIVWENNNDARSTYVFPCTEENYEDTRQRVFDYIMAQEKGKRKLLHTDKCTTIFKEKPLVVVHNSLKSWASKIIRVDISEIDVEEDRVTPQKEKTSTTGTISSVLTKDVLKELTKSTIHVEYELDPDLHFYDDQMWDDDGDPVILYYNGEKSLSRERDYKVTKSLINDALADCEIESVEDVYELLCEHVVGLIGDDLDEIVEGVDVSLEIEGRIVYNTNIDN